MFDQVPADWVHFVKAGISSLVVIVMAVVLYITISRVLRAAEHRALCCNTSPCHHDVNAWRRSKI